MDDELEMKPTHGYSTANNTTTTVLSQKMIIIISVIIGSGLAIGLGVGLGVGLQSDNKPEPAKTTLKPAVTTTNGQVVTMPPTTKSTTVSQATTSTNPVEPDTTTTEVLPPDTTTSARGEGPWLNFRLPVNIVPSHYDLKLHPNMTTDDYTGTNAITFNVTESTKYVLFHAHETLEIDADTMTLVEKKNGNDIDIVEQFRWPEYEYYVIEVSSQLSAGKEYVLTVNFYNSLVKAIVGIYKSTYIDPIDKIEKGIVGSDMEPTDSRRGYPCFDEPALKIRYTTTIIHEQNHTALSNMPVNYTSDIGNGLNETVFDISVPMSTYLGCFVVCEFEYVQETSKRGVPLRIYGSKYQIEQNQTALALRVTKAMFDNFEELLGVNYSLPKYDQIAIPNFGTGAMENWGLVTYRETNLLWDPIESSTYNMQRVVAVVAHELVHQWFGNIVTMKWWDNLWLNEGFASYLEYIGQQWAQPDWQMEGHHVIDDLQTAMRVDSSVGSHPIVINVSSPAQITEVFDTITYQKGSTVLRMMNSILGDELFFGGLNNYLNKRMFGNADEKDLWEDVQEFIDKSGSEYNITEIMDPWVNQFGLPVVNVNVDHTRGEKAVATQEHMLADADAKSEDLESSPYNYSWTIKLDYFTENKTETTQEGWLDRGEDDIEFNVTDFGSWLKFNSKERGYYRVNYDSTIWEALVGQLESNHSELTAIDRCHLLDDGFNLAPAGRISYTQALNLTTYLEAEESYFVWDAFSSGSSYIRVMLASTDSYGDFKTYYLTRVKPIADKLGWNATIGSHEDKRNRPTVLGLALRYDDEEHLSNATDLFSKWRGDEYIYPDIRQLVYRYGILGGTVDDWEYMLEKYKTENVASEKSNLLRGLAATEDVTLISRLLEYSKDTSIIKDQDFFNCISYISYSENGNAMAWTWVRVEWNYLVERFTLDNRSLGRLIPTIVEDYNTELQKWEVESFFASNPEAGAGDMNRVNALLQIDLNIAWMRDNAEPIGEWLKDRVAELP